MLTGLVVSSVGRVSVAMLSWSMPSVPGKVAVVVCAEEALAKLITSGLAPLAAVLALSPATMSWTRALKAAPDPLGRWTG